MDNISVLTIQKYLDSKNIATGDGDTWKEKDVSWESQTPLQNSLKGQTQSLLHPSRPGLATPSPRSPLRTSPPQTSLGMARRLTKATKHEDVTWDEDCKPVPPTVKDFKSFLLENHLQNLIPSILKLRTSTCNTVIRKTFAHTSSYSNKHLHTHAGTHI